MQACKYNTKEFAPFTSGTVRIKPEPTDDWRVTTGGFRNSTDVLNLTSAKLNQTVYDIGSYSFFKFMKSENVTMNGDKIVGSYAIGTQRVLRKESDYIATMSKITERKSTVIAKKDMILGHEYETVCGSTFIFAGTRYFIKDLKNKSGVKLTKNKKYYLAYNGKATYWTLSVSDVTAKKVVKDHGLKKDKEFLDKEIEIYIEKQEIFFSSVGLEKQDYKLSWIPTNEKMKNRFNEQETPEFLANKDGFVYMITSQNYRNTVYNMLEKSSPSVWTPSKTEIIKYDGYIESKVLDGFFKVLPKWEIK